MSVYKRIFKLNRGVFFSLQNNDGSQKISGDALKNVYKSFVSKYPIVSIEDPFDQDDWNHYSKMTDEIGTQVQIVGDDLLVTNPTVIIIYFYLKTEYLHIYSFCCFSIYRGLPRLFTEGFSIY